MPPPRASSACHCLDSPVLHVNETSQNILVEEANTANRILIVAAQLFALSSSRVDHRNTPCGRYHELIIAIISIQNNRVQVDLLLLSVLLCYCN